MRSRFAARQLIFAHAAITDLQGRRLLHDQRIARSSGSAAVDLGAASQSDTAIHLRDWLLLRQGEVPGAPYLARAQGAGFAFDLTLASTQPLILQGEQGFSRKGPDEAQASFYYSVPHLKVAGHLTLQAQTHAVSGSAWLDHEWSNTLLHPDAVGWDWIGINLHDGSSLTAFQLRTRDGAALWCGGSWRAGSSLTADNLATDAVRFIPLRRWRSPASGATYPVDWRVEIARPGRPQLVFGVRAVLDDQELDSRQSTGAIYWEGLSELQDESGRPLGQGYLEMTGYASPLRLG